MSQLTIGVITSRIRGIMKAVRQDSFMTDRYIYSLFKKHAALSIRRLDEKKKLTAFASIFETLDFVKLEEIDKVEASQCGVGPKSYTTIRRTCLPIPVFMEGVYGPMIRSITSLDGETMLKLTTPDEYNYISRSANFRFNTQRYAWYLNDRLYFPNIDWPAVKIDAMVEEDITPFKCNYDQKCEPRQNHSVNVPDFILAEIEASVLKDLGFSLAIPSDSAHDNVNINR
jgi:hypothetical protein